MRIALGCLLLLNLLQAAVLWLQQRRWRRGTATNNAAMKKWLAANKYE